MPEMDFSQLMISWGDTQRDRLIWRDATDAELQVIQGDSPIRIGGTLDPEAEEVFGRLEGWRDGEWTKERLFIFQGPLKAKVWDFFRSGMDSLVVVLMDFLGKDLVGRGDIRNILPDTGAHQMVLDPAVGAFDLTLGLRRECIDRLNTALGHDLFPLGIDVVSKTEVPGVELIAAANEPKDRVAVDVEGVGEAIAQNQTLKRFDMCPDCLGFHQVSIEEIAGEVIQRGDEVPFDLCSRSPEVVGGIMLDQLADVAGEDFPIMHLMRAPGLVEAVLLGPVDNRR